MLETNALSPIPPKRPRKPRTPSLMSAKEADEAAVNAGFVSVRAKHLEGCARLGQYGTELGPLQMARGILLFTLSEIQLLMKQADNLISKNPEPEVEAGVIASKERLVTSLLNTSRGLIDSCKVDIAQPAPTTPPVQPGFGPGAAVQINFGTPPPALPPAEIPVAVKTDAE